MSDLHQPDREAWHESVIDGASYNESALEELAWAIEASVGQFKLFLARCNYTSLRSQLVERLRESMSVEIHILELNESEKTLYARIQGELAEEQPDVLMVFGLESVGDLDRLLSATNQVREEFRKNFHFPVVLWVSDEVFQKLLGLAPDFESWAITTDFTLTTHELVSLLKETAERFFEGNLTLTLSACQEIKLACQDLQSREQVLNLELTASIESLLGFIAYSDVNNRNIDQALEHYQKGLKLWRQNNNLERQGQLLSDIAFCYYLKALRHQEIDHPTWQTTRHYLHQCLEVFEAAQRPDLVANSILLFGLILRRLQDWEQLQTLAQKALQLHQIENKPIEMAQDYGFLAEVALADKRWKEARNFAQRAIKVSSNVSTLQLPIISGIASRLPNHQSVISNAPVFYRFLLAQAQQHLNQNQEAIYNLEIAREVSSPEFDTRFYLDILSHLQRLYFDQKEYLKAFEIKIERQSIEQQYGFRSFVGAGRIQAQRQVKFALTQVKSQETIAPEITASGRQLDVERLTKRIGRNDCKLIVIHGESGVGKSSLVYGGLVPALKQKVIGTSDFLPVPMRVYTSWVGELGKLLAEALLEKGINLPTPLDSQAAILEQLQQSESRNLRTVLIFDQFEEFFFVYPAPGERRQFFEFLGACLNILPVKVILSLREDYLHYLLECDRLPSMKIIGNDILTHNVRYQLGNFSPTEAKAIVERLTERSSFHLEPALIEQLVQDLAGNLEEVRPIELQIVGAQLQTDNITTLAEYRERGQKQELVKRYLAEVVSDCGAENEEAAELVLYLLTDEKGTRPLKTRAEVERDLQALAADFKAEASRLDLVLKIFVDSGLVVLLPELPADRYQLVHDYLAAFIRQQQEPRLKELIAELEKERERRQLSEQRLNRVTQANQVLMAAQQQAKREPLEQKVGRWMLFITAIGIFSGIIGLRLAGLLQSWEWAAFDQFFRLRPLERIDPRIVIVEINEADLHKIKKWPLPDATIAKVLEKLKQQKPRAIGLDLYRDLPVPPGNEELVKVFESTPNLIGIQRVGQNNSGLIDGSPTLSKLGQLGANNIVIDTDGTVRRSLLSLKDSSGKTITSIGTALALKYLETEGITLEVQDVSNEQLKLGKTIFTQFDANSGGYARADADGYQILSNFRNLRQGFNTISMTDVLEGRIPTNLMRDRIVLIGTTAESMRDYFYTPYSSGWTGFAKSSSAGVEIHADLASQILSAALEGRPLIRVWSKPFEWLWICGWSVIGASISWRFWILRSPQWSAFSIFLGGVGLIGVCYGAFLVGWWLPLIPPVLALVGSAIVIPVVSSNNQLEAVRLYRTLELTVEAYGENLADGRLAVEYFISSTNKTTIAIQVLNKIAINTLDACQTPEEIAAICNQLAWIPSTSSNALDSVLRQFLEISQSVRVALDATSPQHRQELLAQPIATLHHLQESLNSKKDTHQRKALKKIAEYWLTILPTRG